MNPRYGHLDGLRGLACMIVAFSHFVACFYPAWLNDNPAQAHNAWDTALSRGPAVMAYNPALGVAIFFVLSGFVLAESVAVNRPPWPALAARRWLRLCLPIIVVITLIYLALHADAFQDVHAAALQTKSGLLILFYPPKVRAISLAAALTATFTTFFTGRAGDALPLLGTLWTIPYELIGSLLLFAVYSARAGLLSHPFARIMVALFAIIFTWPTPYYGFGLGIALFEIRRALGRDNLPPAIGLVTLGLGLWLASTTFALRGSHLWLVVTAYAHGIPLKIDDLLHAAAAFTVAAALSFRPFQRLLSSPPCQYLGRISYMLYLVQLPVLCSAAVFMFMHAGTNYNLRCLAAFAAYLVVSVGLADITSRLIDRPAIRLSRLATAKNWRR